MVDHHGNCFFRSEHKPLPCSIYITKLCAHFSDHMICRGVINGKADKAAVLPKFSDTLILTLSQSGGRADYAWTLALPHVQFFVITSLIWFSFYLNKFLRKIALDFDYKISLVKVHLQFSSLGMPNPKIYKVIKYLRTSTTLTRVLIS